ncbi:MAG TPA: YegP family protein [Solirubrobacterales bacterium]|nr:YegP family protein [Solirubrobacterales bacterium]
MHFSIWKSTDNQLYFELKGDNNETVAVSETYRRKESAEEAIAAIKRGAASADVLDHSKGTKYDRELP